MCGIAGFVGVGGLGDLERMSNHQVHRGPDASGTWFDETAGIYLGHRRLSIIDLNDGAQPMWTRDGEIGIVFNGEIYNHVELRTELEQQGHIFATDHSDTEVLLHGYRSWGPEVTTKLNGMWAFALYDRRRRLLFCSRDRFGKKPLFYLCREGLFAFASELSALCQHSSVKPKISVRTLQKYFAYGFIPAPNSLYEGIYKLPAGYSLLFDLKTASLRVSKYWDLVLEPFEERPANAEEVWCEQIRDLLGRAVKRRLMSDVPLGVFLSGGIDSSAIAALAACKTEVENLDTFSIGFEEAQFDESHYACQVASKLGTRHHAEKLSLERAKELLPAISGQLDEPFGDSSLLPTYLLCRFARTGVTVALSGDGGDELFAGYAPFRALRTAALYSRMVPRSVHQGIRILFGYLPVSHGYMSLDFKIKRTLRGLSYPKNLWNPVWLGPLEPLELEELFGQPIELEDLYSEAIEAWDSCAQQNIVDRTLQFYTKLYLQDDILVKLDRASMMSSLEARSPFLDAELVDFVRRIPAEYKLRNGQTKYILKKALEPLLPRDILYRRKQGFAVPIGRWFKEGYLKSDFETFGLDAMFAKQLSEDHIQGKQDNRLYLWSHWILSAVTGARYQSLKN